MQCQFNKLNKNKTAMADYSQMVAIPRNEYTQLTAVQNARQPLTQQLYKLESDYQGNRLIPDAYRTTIRDN